MKRLLSISVSKMMLLLTASGFVVALIFAVPNIRALSHERAQLKIDVSFTELAVAVGNLTHELQKERGMSSGYLASGGRNFASELPAQRDRSDAVIAAFRASAQHVATLVEEGSPVLRALSEADARLDGLPSLRAAVDSQSIGVLAAVDMITQVNRTAIRLLPQLGGAMRNAASARAVQRHSIFMTAKDITGLERATGAAGFAQAAAGVGVFPIRVKARFNAFVEKQIVLFDIYQQLASEPLLADLAAFFDSSAAKDVQALRDIALSSDPSAIAAVTPESWFSAITKKIDLIKRIEDAGAAELIAVTEQALKMAQERLMGSVVFLASLLAVMGLSAAWLARRAVKAISATADRVAALADGDIETEIPAVAPADLRRITDALSVFRNHELARLQAEETQHALEMSSTVGIERMATDVASGDFATRLRLRDLTGATKIIGEGLNDIMAAAEAVAEERAARDQLDLRQQRAAAAAGERAVAELNQVVAACIAGDFSQRLTIDDKEGVFAVLCEGVNRIGEVTETGLTELMGVLDAVSDGDLSKRMSEDYEGLFRELGQKINQTSSELSRIVGQIASGAQTVQTSSTELSDAADDLAKRTEKTAASLQETSSAVAQLTASVKNTAAGAQEVGATAKATQTEAAQTVAAATDMVTAMEEIAASSLEISKITSVIDDISFQTNLLALNAGVEAARAGDAGRGFSVVASEVRMLAQRASEAASEINVLITRSEGQVQQGVEIVNRSRAALASIQASISGMTDEVVTMVDRAAEQSAGITDINQAVTQMEQTTQSNAAMFEETNAVAQSMRQEASTLALSVAHFRIGGPDAAVEIDADDACAAKVA
ncbi:MAG: nitrate- and nitrite sensing domain-containing protein [Pseudomonadota bacterium]